MTLSFSSSHPPNTLASVRVFAILFYKDSLMKTFIIIDVTGIVTFITAPSAQQALQLACEQGYKPFVVREA